jgi:HEPN domain-containing protein
MVSCSLRLSAMTPKKIPSRGIEKGKYRIYLNKAQDFYRAMQRSLKDGNWTSAGLEAVHCAISATDALLAFAGGIRCTSQDHGDAAYLLAQIIRSPEATKQSTHFLHIIEAKNIVEYEDRRFTPKEAEEVAKHVERYFSWVKSFLPEKTD